jgi:hypothetical protein
MGDLRSLLKSISEQDAVVTGDGTPELPEEFVRHVMTYILHGKLS